MAVEKSYPGHPDLTGGGQTGLHSHAGGSGLTFIELAGNEDHNATIDDWQDWDLSAIVPVGAKVIHLGIKTDSNSNARVSARKNGTATTREYAYRYKIDYQTLDVECDANRVIEVKADPKEKVYFGVLGYWS